MSVIVDAIGQHYRCTLGIGGAFVRHIAGKATCVLRVNADIGAIRIPEPLSKRLRESYGHLAIGQVVAVPLYSSVWLTRPIEPRDKTNAAALSALGIEILPTGTEVELPGPEDAGVLGARYWAGRPPQDSYRVRAADLISDVLSLGRVIE